MSSNSNYARIAGVGYVVIFALAMHANFAVLGGVPSYDDPAAVLAYAQQNAAAVRFAVVEFLIVMAADILVALALFKLFEPRAPFLNALSTLFRVGYTVAHIPVILTLASAVRWATNDAVDPSLASVMTVEAFRAYGQGFTLTLAFFGLHLMMLGALIIRAGRAPIAVLGALVAIAGTGYVWDALSLMALPDVRERLGDLSAMIVILPALLGEGLLMIWLLLGGPGLKR
ncbi:MAG: DUF4386 domain-containing protein [Parvularculaceae bacterium]|nr:DUF4386 domain-containing protein [Parvularculaceae bacterium]